MGCVSLNQAIDNRRLESAIVGVVLGVQALLFNKLPQPLDQVEIRRVSRQEAEFDV